MGVLSHDEILKAIDNGEIQITPFEPSAVSSASIDLRLGNKFRYYKPFNGKDVIDVTEDVDYKAVSEIIELKEGESYLLPPGHSCLGITLEEVQLSTKLCGILEGRSRFARLGLSVHVTASFMAPGIKNRQVLEIVNSSNMPLKLHPGTRICQFIFMEMKGEAQYKGIFSKQTL